jgi:hypothetical protein
MTQFRWWQAFPLSFFSQPLYRDVAQRWRGVTFVYLLVLILVWWIPSAVLLQVEGAKIAADYAPKVIDQIPTITVTQGRVSVDAAMPCIITNPEGGGRLAVIDTTGATTTLEQAQAPVLLTRTELIVREGADRSRTYELAEVRQLVVDHARLYDWLGFFRVWFVPLASVFVVLFMYVYRIVQALLYGAIGIVFGRLLRVELDYPALLRVAVMALTPVMLLDTVLGIAGIAAPGPVSLVLALGYLYFGIKANANRDRDAVVAA